MCIVILTGTRLVSGNRTLCCRPLSHECGSCLWLWRLDFLIWVVSCRTHDWVEVRLLLDAESVLSGVEKLVVLCLKLRFEISLLMSRVCARPTQSVYKAFHFFMLLFLDNAVFRLGANFCP